MQDTVTFLAFRNSVKEASECLPGMAPDAVGTRQVLSAGHSTALGFKDNLPKRTPEAPLLITNLSPESRV